MQEKQTTEKTDEKTDVGEVPGQKKQFEISPEKKAKATEAKSRGDEAFRKKDYMLAVDAYTQALDLDPTNTTLFSNRSLCWIRLGQPDHALSDATTARSLKPDWPKAWYREGAALRLLQRFEDAADAFYTGIKLDPENKELVDAFREAVEAGKRFHAAGPLNNQAAK